VYYEQRARQRDPDRCPPRVRRDEVLTGHIHRVWHENQEVYGVRKVWKQLRREGHPVARCTVARLMRPAGLRGAVRGRRFKTTTCPDPGSVAPTGSRHAPVRRGAAESTVGRGSDVRGDVAGLRLRRIRHRRPRPPDRRLARVEFAA
jgi:transposase InsO family protein